MTTTIPTTELDPDFSESHAQATSWDDALKVLREAGIFWLSTVRPDGRPHVTPLIAVWVDDALYFSTGEHERKRKNLGENPHCILTTGCNTYEKGLDIVVEGDAVRVINEGQLRGVAAAYEAKYGPDWHFDVHNDAFEAGGHEAWVYRVSPVTAFGFSRSDGSGQTRWRFPS